MRRHRTTMCKAHIGESRAVPGLSPRTQPVIPAKAGIQYAAACRFGHCGLWDTGSPAFAGDDSRRYSRGAFRPGLANRFAQSRGRRECRVLAAPAVSRARDGVRCAHEHTGTVGALRHSLRNGFTAYAALSPEIFALCAAGLAAPDRSPPQIPFRSARLHFSTRHTVILYPKFSQVFRGQGVEPVFLYASARGGLDADGMLRTCSLAHLRW
jgi:hypothetical protein